MELDFHVLLLDFFLASQDAPYDFQTAKAS